MEKIIDTVLRAFSLSDKETLVFKKLIESGVQPASSVAKACELPRNTVRGILDKLAKQGLVVRSRRANTQLYATERKESLVRLLLQKKENLTDELDSQIAVIKAYGDVLDAPPAGASRPRVTFYDGFRGLVKVYEDTLTSKTGLRSWASFDANQETLPKYFRSYYKRRARRGISMKSIHPDTVLARKQTVSNRKFLRKCVLVPKAKFDLAPEIQVYDNKVNIVSWADKLGVIIESEEIAHALTAIFDLCYDTARRFYPERA